MVVTQRPASPNNYSTGRENSPVNLIVLHTMQGYLAGTDAWFANAGAKVSAHYGVGLSGQVHQYVQDANTAWHAGNWSFNLRSIGIETEDNNNPAGTVRTGQQYDSVAQLVADKCHQFGIPCDRAHIIGHREVPGNNHPNCPGNLDINQVIARAKAILVPGAPVSAGRGGAAPAKPPPPPPPPPAHGTVKITATPWLNLRTQPTSRSPLGVGQDAAGHHITHLPLGAAVQYVDAVHGENVAGNDVWLKSIRGLWFWSGGTDHQQGIVARFLGAIAR